jgi:hypothetical protein
MGSYSLAYKVGLAVAVVGVIAGVLAGIGYTGARPSWETADISATAGLVSAICVGLAALLPQLGRTPAARTTSYLRAAAGVLPDDLAAKHRVIVPPVPPQPPPAA